ncbi:MAG TPA: hypothetical protein VFY10_05130, partial [Dehalococcoidia bacterium]|nr:hypothetical protein [Dehalococcoidia bacterium]
MANYWTRVTQSRVERRKLLRAGAGFGIGAAALSFFGCGGGDNSNSSGSSATSATSGATGASGSSAASGASGATGATGASNGLVSTPVDTTANAKPGGVYVTNITSDPLSFDSISGTFSDVPHAARVYSRLVG